MDDGFEERLIYSASEESDAEDPIESIVKEPIATFNDDRLSPNDGLTENLPQDVPEESDEDDLNKSIRRAKKNARILSSDDEEENSENETHTDGKDSTNDNDAPEHQTAVSVRPSICDSDTKSSSDDKTSDRGEIQAPKMVKKLKKKKHEQRKKHNNNTSNSESNDDSDEENNKKHKKSASGESSSSESSGSDSSTQSNGQTNGVKNVKPREKPVQRMSAKMAEQQMKEIQSESQRMARQQQISVPYHKPKQHSLKEFLSRRSIVQQQEKLNSKPITKAAVAIKMSQEELIQYMEEMNKRTQEAEKFFQEDEDAKMETNDGSSEEEADKSTTDETKSLDTPKESISNELTANDECDSNIIASPPKLSTQEFDEAIDGADGEIDSAILPDNHLTESSSEPTVNPSSNLTSDASPDLSTNLSSASPIEKAKEIELHTVRTELDDELDAMAASQTRVKLSIPPDQVPKLKGGQGFVIDFETNDLKPVPKSGVDELLSRFMKNTLVKPQGVESQDLSIFQTDTGTLERHKVHVNLDDHKPKREPKPGENLFKLRAELGMKIKENREKQIAQRLQEEKEQEINRKLMESEDELELSGDENDCVEEEEMEVDEEENVANDDDVQKENEEKDENEEQDENDGNDEEHAESNDDSENSDESESEALDINEIGKPRKRIVTMDDDSDDENPQQILPNAEIDGHDVNGSETVTNVSTNQSLEESSTILNSHDLSALESEILQLNSAPEVESSKSESTKLFEEDNCEYGEIGESQLMALCSGSFATQFTNNESAQNVDSSEKIQSNEVNTQFDEPQEVTSTSKPAFLSSDEEETEKDANTKVKKRRKKNAVVISDDEEDQEQEAVEEEDEESAEENQKAEEDEEDNEDDEEDPGERYIEYDSDENEVEVELKKSDMKRKVSDFVENEAELSGSDEWGSADEDEKDINRYEAELGDADKFDKNKLRDELERIRLREQIDSDAREIRILTEHFIEEEDNGQERERKFRWKHLNNGDNNDDQAQSVDPELVGEQNSDDENEAQWRRIRYEREQLLKQQTEGNNSAVERISTTIEIAEQKTAENGTTIMNSSRRISIIKPVSSAAPRIVSPFLIAKGDLNAGHLSRKSFLNRDTPILEKLAGLSRSGGDGDAILNTAKGKGNYVFIATEKKDNFKRKSDSNNGPKESEENNPSKKSKLDSHKNTKLRPQTKAFFESLN